MNGHTLTLLVYLGARAFPAYVRRTYAVSGEDQVLRILYAQESFGVVVVDWRYE